jgi:hypothetical protein
MGFKTALKPGDPIALFCADPSPNPDGKDNGEACAADNDCWSMKCEETDGPNGPKKCTDVRSTFFQHCGQSGDLVGSSDSIFEGSWKRVIKYVGAGDPLKLAPALRDRKYYFEHFGYAIVKYLLAANVSPPPTNLNVPELGPGGTACGGRSCEPDADHLRFDQIGVGGDRNKLSYTDRRWADHGKDPVTFEYEILIISGNQQETRFRQHLDRDEKAIFWAMSPDKKKPLTDEANNIRLTNIIGSTVLQNWSGVGDTKDAYYCATNLGPSGQGDPDCLNPALGGGPANGPPKYKGAVMLDGNGKPLLSAYRGAFTGTPFAIGSAFMTLVQPQPYTKSATVAIPFFADPYAPAIAAGSPPPRMTMPDWTPLAPGAGLLIPLDGQRDRFLPAAKVDFSGQNLDMTVAYQIQPDKTMKILGIESHTFEGSIFLCQDPITHDLLSVQQYDSVANIQAWISSHPGVYEACDLLVRNSAIDSSPVQVAAKKAGVVLTVGQGSGVGRVVDAFFYDPSL